MNADLHRIWHCNWDWCPKSFQNRRDLFTHLKDVHLKNILIVHEKAWSVYLRATEGKSGATDSFFASLPIDTSTQRNTTQQNHTSSPPAGSLPYPDESPSVSRSSFVAPALGQHAASTPPRARKQSRSSFAGVSDKSSPMTPPSVDSLPPSPSLAHLVSNAVMSRQNAIQRPLSPTPLNPQSRKRKGSALPGPTRPSVLQRNLSPGVSSSGSSRDVEEALTQNIEESPERATPDLGKRASGPSRESPSKSLSLVQSYALLRAQSQAQDRLTRPSDTNIGPSLSLASHSDPQAPGGPTDLHESSRSGLHPQKTRPRLPLPRSNVLRTSISPSDPLPPPESKVAPRRRSRSKTLAHPPVVVAPPSRVLRSRSKTPSAGLPPSGHSISKSSTSTDGPIREQLSREKAKGSESGAVRSRSKSRGRSSGPSSRQKTENTKTKSSLFAVPEESLNDHSQTPANAHDHVPRTESDDMMVDELDSDHDNEGGATGGISAQDSQTISQDSASHGGFESGFGFSMPPLLTQAPYKDYSSQSQSQ